MTLIISLAHRFGVTQVVDRLVTAQHLGGVRLLTASSIRLWFLLRGMQS
jgi:hypothetical protein